MQFSSKSFNQEVVETTDPVILHEFSNLLAVWGQEEHQHNQNTTLPRDFAQRMMVVKVARQPAGVVRGQIQYATRTLQEEREPHKGKVDKSDWPTRDLFSLTPHESDTFRESGHVETTRVPGRERSEACRVCQGNGQKKCTICKGSGRIKCHSCKGNRKQECGQCGGSGELYDARGKLRHCQTCAGTGSTSCRNCDHAGTQACNSCHESNGHVPCTQCKGNGAFRLYWVVKTRYHGEVTCDRWLSANWAAPTKKLLASGESCATWDLLRAKGRGDLDLEPIERIEPTSLRNVAKTIVRRMTSSTKRPDASSRMTSFRLELLGCWVHKVDFVYAGKRYSTTTLGPNHQFVPTKNMPKESKSLGAYIGASVSNFWNGKPTLVREEPSQQFRDMLQRNEVHRFDHLCIIPFACKLIGAKAQVVDDGYDLEVQAKTANNPPVQLRVAPELDEFDSLTLRTAVVLGPAHRDRFPDILSRNHSLEMGRVGVLETENAMQLALVDCRAYDTLHRDHYAKILQIIASEFVELVSDASLR